MTATNPARTTPAPELIQNMALTCCQVRSGRWITAWLSPRLRNWSAMTVSVNAIPTSPKSVGERNRASAMVVAICTM